MNIILKLLNSVEYNIFVLTLYIKHKIFVLPQHTTTQAQ